MYVLSNQSVAIVGALKGFEKAIKLVTDKKKESPRKR